MHFSPRRMWRFVNASLIVMLVAGCGPDAPQKPAPSSGTHSVRVVSLAPSLTEIICAVGGADRLVGRTDVCNYPPDVVSHVPVVANFGQPFLEAVAAQHPTLALDTGLADESMGDALVRLGFVHRHIVCERLEDIPAAIRTTGQLIGRDAAAQTLAAMIEAGIRERRAAIANPKNGKKPLVFVEIWCDPLMTAGKNSFVSDLVTLAGGVNLGDELTHDYATVSTEWILDRNPDVVLCLFHGAGHGARQQVLNRTGWQNIHAVQTGRVYDDFDLDTILRPSPRVLTGEAQLRRAISGEKSN